MTPSVHVTNGGYSLEINVPLRPDPQAAARGDAAGLPGLVPGQVEKCLELAEVKRWLTLNEQITAAEARVAAAERTFKQVAAAKTLLEAHPEPDLAEKLRAIEARLAAAQADRAAATADLSTIRHLIPGLWADAANAVRFKVSQAMLDYLLKVLTPAQAAAEKKLAAALEKLSAVVGAAVEELVVGPAAELAAAKHAHLRGWDHKDKYVGQVVAGVVGPKPAGVRDRGVSFEIEPTTPQPAAR